jgi:hypothetical protein
MVMLLAAVGRQSEIGKLLSVVGVVGFEVE